MLGVSSPYFIILCFPIFQVFLHHIRLEIALYNCVLNSSPFGVVLLCYQIKTQFLFHWNKLLRNTQSLVEMTGQWAQILSTDAKSTARCLPISGNGVCGSCPPESEVMWVKDEEKYCVPVTNTKGFSDICAYDNPGRLVKFESYGRYDFLLFLFLIIFILCIGMFCQNVCIWTICIFLDPANSRRGHLIPWNEN